MLKHSVKSAFGSGLFVFFVVSWDFHPQSKLMSLSGGESSCDTEPTMECLAEVHGIDTEFCQKKCLKPSCKYWNVLNSASGGLTSDPHPALVGSQGRVAWWRPSRFTAKVAVSQLGATQPRWVWRPQIGWQLLPCNPPFGIVTIVMLSAMVASWHPTGATLAEGRSGTLSCNPSQDPKPVFRKKLFSVEYWGCTRI